MARLGWLLIGILLFARMAWAQSHVPDKSPPELSDYNWEQDAKKKGLKDSDIAQLNKQGLVITSQTVQQIFTPYLGGQVFVTSDCIINAYSILLQDAVTRLERKKAHYLRLFIAENWAKLCTFHDSQTSANPELKVAMEQAQMVIGVAQELISGQKVSGCSPELIAEIDEETQRVITHTGQSKPKWLGPPDPGFLAIDYTRFKPVGFYSGHPKLEAYFRCVSWLEAIPFRINKDPELLTYMVIYKVVNDKKDGRPDGVFQQLGDIEYGLSQLLGAPDEVDLFVRSIYGNSWDSKATMGSPDYLKEARNSPMFNAKPSEYYINDQLALQGERSVRILSGRTIPDEIVFSRTEELRRQPLPSGLYVAAFLGSPKARQLLASNSALLAKIDEQKPCFDVRSHYAEYLRALATLLQPVDKDAPDLFHGPAWQNKSLQTVLGGWCQERHALVLETKLSISWLGQDQTVSAGFIEPVPDFFGQISALCEKELGIFKWLGAFSNDDCDEAVEQLRNLAPAVRAYGEGLKKDPAHVDRSELIYGGDWIYYVDPQSQVTVDDYEVVASKLEALADRLDQSGPGNDENLKAMVNEINASPEENWNDFILMCSRLEALSQKQLRSLPFSDRENEFLAHFGEKLANVMFYGGNSYDTPRDDAPRICNVYGNPEAEKILEVGIGRPQIMYVLYPYAGKQILVEGAVMPYYELEGDANAGGSTDKEWADRLQKPDAPAQPDWLH